MPQPTMPAAVRIEQYCPPNQRWLMPIAVPLANCISRLVVRGSWSVVEGVFIHDGTRSVPITVRHCPSAIDNERLAGHHPGVTGQEQDCIGDVVRARRLAE